MLFTLLLAAATNALPMVGFVGPESTGPENHTPARIVVGLSSPSPQEVSVDYQISGTAINGSDYVLKNGSLSIPAGSQLAEIQIPIIDDAQVEANEWVILRLSNPRGASLGNATFRYIIQDNEQASRPITKATQIQILGRDGNGNVMVAVNAPSDQDVMAEYQIQIVTANSTYMGGSGTVTIPAGQSNAVITIPMAMTRPATVTVTLSNPRAAQLGPATLQFTQN